MLCGIVELSGFIHEHKIEELIMTFTPIFELDVNIYMDCVYGSGGDCADPTAFYDDAAPYNENTCNADSSGHIWKVAAYKVLDGENVENDLETAQVVFTDTETLSLIENEDDFWVSFVNAPNIVKTIVYNQYPNFFESV